MQRSVSRLVLTVYIAESFSDEALYDVPVPIPVDRGGWVEGCMAQLIISQQWYRHIISDYIYNAQL